MTDMNISWTDERVELLARLWSEGLSASQIAAQLGGVTRNAVIGKVHRLGLSGRAKPNAEAAPAERPRPKLVRPVGPSASPIFGAELSQSASPAVHGAEAIPSEDLLASDLVEIPVSERVSIMELRDSMCRWPIGDPASAEFGYCGTRAITGLPYCPNHARVAYQPATDRRRDRRLAIRA